MGTRKPNAWNFHTRFKHKDNVRHANAHMRAIRTTNRIVSSLLFLLSALDGGVNILVVTIW